MRHRKDHRRLGRPTDQRIALLRSATGSLFRHNHVKTTLGTAREMARFAEKLIGIAKAGDLHARRRVLAELNQPDAVAQLFSQIAPRYTDRNGGFTRVIHAGARRGDGAPMAIVELVE
jgi:large subunit ribosomal protein L17